MQTKKCKYCKTEIDSTAKVCPNCRRKQGGKAWKIILPIIIILIIGAAIPKGNEGTQSTDTSGQSQEAAEKKEEKKEDFTISETTTESDSFSMYIIGTITNNTDKDKGYVQVTFNLYDDDGNQVGTAMDNINNLKAGGTWKFKAIALDKSATKYQLAEITGF